MAWLNARPSVEARDITLDDGSPIPSYLAPYSPYWASRTAIDMLHDFAALTERYPHAEAFRLQCSPSCVNRLCHGEPLALELEGFLAANLA